MVKILEAPNKILELPAEEIKQIDQRIKKIVGEMEKCLISQKDPLGVGLAAPQIGYSLRLFIMKPHPKAKVEVFVNPIIVRKRGDLDFLSRSSEERLKRDFERDKKDKSPTAKPRKDSLEGCLSLPRVWAPVKRASKVLVEYENIVGEKKKEWFSNFKSAIVQHEVDHLQGILFTQRALEQKVPIYEEKAGKLKKLISF